MQLARRRFLQTGLVAASATAVVVPAARLGREFSPDPVQPVLPAPLVAPAPLPILPIDLPRRAFVHNLHTGETLDAVYFEKGRYVPDALASAMRVLRDWRNGEEHAMDPRLFDVMHDLRAKLETRAPFQIISGYRSPATNAMLHERSSGVASKSQHVLGRASDIRVQGVELANVHKAALALGAGGVGLYPVSNFVHVDVGPVRSWMGS